MLSSRNRITVGGSLRVVGGAAAVLLVLTPPATAGLLTPLLQLIRPRLESQLQQTCVEMAGGGNRKLELSLQAPCRQLAGHTSRCLIEETDRSGRSLGVISELISGRFGDDSEEVVKRCLARMFGLPPNSLRDVPLRVLAQRFARSSDQTDAPEEVVP
ncbi:MAG: hypothetical protein VKK98_06115 [Cyanobacteriota bacterium]|nr:hypothetical protein [Cyanobacteriota bacterium]